VAGTVQIQRDGPNPSDSVEERFVAGMQEHRFGLSEILTAVRLWRDFRAQAQPTYRNPGGYAAAVEYVICLLGLYEGSLALAGDFYGVSKSTVSRNYRKIRDRLKLVQFDPRYELVEDLSQEPAAMGGERGKPPPGNTSGLRPSACAPELTVWRNALTGSDIGYWILGIGY